MGNINQVDNNTHQFVHKNRKTNKAGSDNTFKQTFGEVLGNMESSKIETLQPGGLKELPQQNFQFPDPSGAISDKTENLVELLELYASKLKDKSISLKEVDSVLKEVGKEAQALLEKIENSSGVDEKMKNIANQVAVFANTEQIKFQRGDYLS